MSIEHLIQQITQLVEERATVRTVFGDPIKLDKHTIVPVAKVLLAGGGGGGGREGEKGEGEEPLAAASATNEAAQPRAVERGGGGGGTFSVTPLGFIHERNGEVVFTAIESPSVVTGLLERLPGALATRLAGRFGKKPPKAP